MTVQTHPSLDELADLREGLLPSARARGLAAHLRECDTCSQASAALDDVTRVLSVAASDPVPMPRPVAASLDAALHRASRERAAAVPSLSQYRASSRTDAAPARPPRWTWLAAAAAAVAFGYAGVNLLDSTSDSDDSAGSATDAAEAATDRLASRRAPATSQDGGPSTGFRPEGTGADDFRVTRETLPAFAVELASTSATDDRPGQECPSVDVNDDDRTALVRWRGARALVVVDRSTQRVTVYRCTGDAGRLFATRY